MKIPRPPKKPKNVIESMDAPLWHNIWHVFWPEWIVFFMVPYVAALVLFGWPWHMFILFAYLGYTLGKMRGRDEGMTAQKEIIANVYGENWSRDAVEGQMMRKARQQPPVHDMLGRWTRP